MIRLSELSAARSTELELRYNGPIPREMIEWAWAQDRADETKANSNTPFFATPNVGDD